MRPTGADPRGTITRGRNVWRVQNALVEEVFTTDGRTGHLIVSHVARMQNHMTSIELLRLNVNRNTGIRNQFGRPVSLRDIRRGMWVDAEFSPAMTRSIPPQTNAFQIVVQERALLPQWPQPHTTTDLIMGIDANNNTIITGNLSDITRLRRFVITGETVIVNRAGNRIPLRDLRQGQVVEVTHANFQTLSIPPQTTAFRIRVL